MDTIGTRLKDLRKRAGLTQKKVCDGVGITQGFVSELESGKKSEMGADILMGLCRTLTTTPEFLMYGKGESRMQARSTYEAELLAIFRTIPEDKQSLVLGMLKGAATQGADNTPSAALKTKRSAR